MCLGLDKMYSETIDGLDESIRKKVYALLMSRCNTFHVPVHSVFFLMDKAFRHTEHESVAKLVLGNNTISMMSTSLTNLQVSSLSTVYRGLNRAG